MPRDRRLGNKAKNKYKDSMTDFIRGMGRKLFIYLSPNRNECPNCYYDKKSRKSSGIPKVAPDSSTYFTVGRCPVCLGEGVLTTERRRCINGMVIWNPTGEGANEITINEAGYEGATKVQIKTDPCHLNLIKEASYIKIDGVICKLSNPPIIRGVGNKTVLVANFFTTAKMNNDSGEYI